VAMGLEDGMRKLVVSADEVARDCAGSDGDENTVQVSMKN
jgi:hypothetical protein